MVEWQQDRTMIRVPRIDRGTWLIVVGIIAGAVGLFALVAAAGGSGVTANLAAALFLPLSLSAFVMLFWVRIFRAIELRLIDIEVKVATKDPPAEEGDAPPA